MKEQQFTVAVYILFIGLFIFLLSFNDLKSPTGNLILPQPGSSKLIPTACSSTSWTACQKAFADDTNKATVTVGSGVTKYVKYNFSFSQESLVSQSSRILNVTIKRCTIEGKGR